MELAFRAAQTPDLPLVIMFHGATRHIVGHQGWFSHFGHLCDVALGELPGHGQAPRLNETSLPAFIAAFDEAIAAAFPGRTILAVGESVGGLVAMGLTTAQRVVALDPPMEVAKLWPLADTARTDPADAQDFWFGVFGLGPRPEPRVYWDLVERQTAPILILAGDRPLGVRRALPMPPSLLDAADRARLGGYGHVIVQVVANAGHGLLDEALGVCLNAVRQELARLGPPDG